MNDGKIQFAESLSFIIIYVIYLIVVIGGHFINRRIKNRQVIHENVASETYGSIQTHDTTNVVSVDNNINTNISDESYVQPDVSYALYLRHAFLPRDDEPWTEKSKLNRMFSIIKVR